MGLVKSICRRGQDWSEFFQKRAGKEVPWKASSPKLDSVENRSFSAITLTMGYLIKTELTDLIFSQQYNIIFFELIFFLPLFFKNVKWHWVWERCHINKKYYLLGQIRLPLLLFTVFCAGTVWTRQSLFFFEKELNCHTDFDGVVHWPHPLTNYFLKGALVLYSFLLSFCQVVRPSSSGAANIIWHIMCCFSIEDRFKEACCHVFAM